MIIADTGSNSATAALDVIQSVGPALLALGGVWLGSRFARGREDRSWRRTQIVEASRTYLAACAAVEQWGASAQFAERLGEGQYPTEYKRDLESLDSATGVLRISTGTRIVDASELATERLREYVAASARHEANRPRGSGMQADRKQRDLEQWREAAAVVENARTQWIDARRTFVSAVRSELDAFK